MEVFLDLNRGDNRMFAKNIGWFFKFCIAALIFNINEVYSQTDTCGTHLLETAKYLKEITPQEYNRLKKFREWLLEINKPCSAAVISIKDRIATLNDTTTYKIDTTGISYFGLPSAPIHIIMYISMSCPLCKRLYCELTDSIFSGSIKPMAKLSVKPFGNNILNRSLVAVNHWNKQHDLIRALAPIKQRLTIDTVLQVAGYLNIPIDTLKSIIEDQSTIDYVNNSTIEAARNGVNVTPTLFFNFHRYSSYKDSRWVSDAVEWIYNRLRTVKKDRP